MIFDVSPSQIEQLDGKQLVELLRKLLHSEAQSTGISLSGVSVPLQITVPDGGEDARISWTDGHEKTDFLPNRFCIFQSKASDIKPAGWKKEVWTKSSKKKGSVRRLNDAVTRAISFRGAYIGFTSATLQGGKYDDCINAIKSGINEAEADPYQLAKIDIYDANKIAEWVTRHPAVAVWLNECQSGFFLRGFRTIAYWGKKSEISSIKHVTDNAERYLLGDNNVFDQQESKTPEKNTLSFQQARERITDFLADPQMCVRILGPSGVGKSRFVFEVFNDESTLAKSSLSTSAIYCDYRDIGPQIYQIAQSLSQSGTSCLIIVDECLRETAIKLLEFVTSEDSKLKVLTIGNDDRPIDNCLNLFIEPADDTLVDGIIRQRYPKAEDADISFIKSLSGGFPRIAVLATDNYSENLPILKSIEDVVERILTGCNIHQADQVRAIECLALFNRLGADKEFSNQINYVAANLARQSGDEMYEHLAQASKHHLVDRRARYFKAQPLPIAAFLGARRLDLLRVTTVVSFIENAEPDLLLSFLNQWRYFNNSRTAVAVAEQLLSRNGWLGSLDVLNSELGSKCLDALAHVDPDTVSDTLKRVFGELSIDELMDVKDARRSLVWTLDKLVFRRRSFPFAARLLMLLAAAENESWGNNATGRFTELFQLYLSGTEADPVERFAVLDEGLCSSDERVVSVCISALEKTLIRGPFTRTGGSEQIGSQPPLKDWRPKLWSEVFDFHLQGLRRLNAIRDKEDKFAKQCEMIITSHLREILCENLFNDIEIIVKKIASEKGIWLEAIESIGDWLYFDRKGAPKKFAKKVRNLYEGLMPTDLLLKALLYTKFWSADIRDPDVDYDQDAHDYEYSSRKAREIAAEIATNKATAYHAIKMMAAEELNNAFPFANELAMRIDEPVEAFKIAVQAVEESVEKKGMQFIRGMLAGIDERDRIASSACVDIALKSATLKNQAVNIYTSVNITIERLDEIVKRLKEGSFAAADCAFLSYGKGLDNLEVGNILPLINELTLHHEAEGVWTALEIISMYQHGRRDLDWRLAELIMQQIAAPKLLGTVRRATRDGYLFESLCFLVHKHFGISDDFAVELSKQIIRLCQVEKTDVFFALDDPARKLIKLLVNEKPKVLWEVVSRFFEIAASKEAHWLENLIGPSAHGIEEDGHYKKGALFGISEQDCIGWAKVDPPNRVPFLCLFFPLLETKATGECHWHPAIETLTYEFGTVEKFRRAIARRMYPRSWSGSIIPYLKVYLKPLEAWCKHPVPEMSLWAHEMIRTLEKEISSEKNREAEDEYR